MKLYQTGAPMERMALDILGPLPETEYGNKYILCIGDYFTKWVEAIPLPDQEAKTVAEALISTICRIGIPRQIHTDQGRNFQSPLFSELCEMLDIDKTRTTPYRPQSDGMIERFNRTLAAMLRNFVSQEQKDWDIQLPYVMMAYRSAVHNSTGYSPNQMMLGREVNLPLDLVIGRHSDEENPDEYVQRQRQTLQEVHTLARANLKLSGERQKRNYDLRQSRNKFKFEIGQSVWYYCPMKRKGISPKLQTQWYGPCKVKRQISNLLYEIETPRTLYKKVQDIVVHCNKLRPYTTENYVTERHTTPNETSMTTSNLEQGNSTLYISKYGHRTTHTVVRTPSTLLITYLSSMLFSLLQMNQKPNFPCCYCSYICGSRQRMREHMAQKHSSPIIPPSPAKTAPKPTETPIRKHPNQTQTQRAPRQLPHLQPLQSSTWKMNHPCSPRLPLSHQPALFVALTVAPWY